MYWYKVKTLLICMFAAINVFLIVFIVQGNVRQTVAEKKEMQSLIEVLSINDIFVDESIFSMKNPPVKTATVENLAPSGEEMAKLMLGDGFLEEFDAIGNNYYSKDGKIVSVHGGRLYYYDGNLTGDTNINPDVIPMISEKLKGFNIDVSKALGEAIGDKIIYTYYFDDLPLFENTLYVKTSGETICEIGGYMIGITEGEETKTYIAPPKSALVSFLQDKNRSGGKKNIKFVSLGFSALLADTDVNFKITETIPTYKIVTDNNEVYYYDARK